MNSLSGQHNDSRMNMALILTAVKYGATVANYCEVVQLHKDASGKLNGARVRDNLTGEEWNVRIAFLCGGKSMLKLRNIDKTA